jgi:hypothetical protein
MWPVAVINCASFIDSAWDVACLRAQRGGKLLANMLAARLHGDRPATLLGVSVGARLVYYCLLELYKLGARALLLPAPPSLLPACPHRSPELRRCTLYAAHCTLCRGSLAGGLQREWWSTQCCWERLWPSTQPSCRPLAVSSRGALSTATA